MNRKSLDLIQEKLSVLIKQPLRSISRGGGSIFIDFGDVVEKDSLYWTEDRKAAIKKHCLANTLYTLNVRQDSSVETKL